MILQFGFVFDDLPIKFVDQRIDCGIQIDSNAFHMQILSSHMQIDFCFLSFLFLWELINGQDDRYINDMIEVACNAFQLVLYIFANGWGQFEVMSTDGEIHTRSYG